MGASIRSHYEITPQNSPSLGARVIANFPRTADLESIMIALSGTVTLGTAASGLITDGISNIIQSVELLADNGKTTVLSVPFSSLANANFPRRKRGITPSVTQPGITAAAHPFEIEATVDFGYGMFRPKDTFLRETDYADLKLALRFAPDWSGVFAGGFVVSGESFGVTIAVKDSLEIPDENGQASAPVVRYMRTANDISVVGASRKIQFRMTPDQGVRGVGLRVVDSSGALSDSSLERVRVYQGKRVRLDVAASTLKETLKSEYVGGILTGYYVIDFADGVGLPDKIADMLDLTESGTGGADSYIEFDTTASCTITVDQHGYIEL